MNAPVYGLLLAGGRSSRMHRDKAALEYHGRSQLAHAFDLLTTAVEQVFSQGLKAPSQFCFITGPSSTGDIQAVQFKGMHGPVKVIVIFVTGQD